MSVITDILFERRGSAGVVTLNRASALNAVTHAMVRALANKLGEWAKDASVTRVLVKAAGERAFSAGGDIRALYDLGRGGRQDKALQFWREEYTLNTLIKRYPKPYIAFIDGIVMGGGVGISIHGSHRIAGDHFQFAMPEVGIGFFPDVGATWFLPRMPGEIGTYCALTGDRLKAADALATGIVTHSIPSNRWRELFQTLADGQTPVDVALAAHALDPLPGPIASRRKAIDRLFEADRVEEIVRALDRESEGRSDDAGFAGVTAAVIRAKSPLSLKIALAQVRRGREWTFNDCMKAEFRIVNRIVNGRDFYEGVRAVIIDKDQKPVWRPASLSAVPDSEVERHFEPLGAAELVLS
jgi:enoyl-CoA hydratase